MRGRLLGVDFGTVRIGIAISDAEQILASPLATYHRRDEARDAAYFAALVKAENVSGLVIGIPIHLDDFEGDQALDVRRFGDWLASVTLMPVAYQDERYTSVEAESILRGARLTHKKRKAQRDKIAAQLILAAYLERNAHTEPQSREEEI